MLTLERVRLFSRDALDYTSRDIRQALENCQAIRKAGILPDVKRESEYADELHLIARVRFERQARPCCASCGHVSP